MFNKKIIAIGLLGSSVLLASMTTLQVPQQQQPRPQPKLTNIKVLPKSLSYQQVDHLMDEWAKALGVRCNFCHDNANKALDTKPEKAMARKMFAMEGKINKKFFGAKKDSLGLMTETGINCNTCHRGVSHPKVVYANVPGARPNFGAPGQGGPGGAPGQGGQRPAGGPGGAPATPPTNR
jgi:hypothetical protein